MYKTMATGALASGTMLYSNGQHQDGQSVSFQLEKLKNEVYSIFVHLSIILSGYTPDIFQHFLCSQAYYRRMWHASVI